MLSTVHGQRCRKTTTLHGRPDIKDQYDLIQRHNVGSCKLAGVLLTHLHMGEWLLLLDALAGHLADTQGLRLAQDLILGGTLMPSCACSLLPHFSGACALLQV
jgi:hypothetical protein